MTDDTSRVFSSPDHLRLWIAFLPEFKSLQVGECDHRAVVQLHLDGFKTFFDRLGKNEVLFGPWHVLSKLVLQHIRGSRAKWFITGRDIAISRIS